MMSENVRIVTFTGLVYGFCNVDNLGNGIML